MQLLTHLSQKILLVEDDRDTSDATAMLLESEGFTVHQAGNGVEALQYLARVGAPCLIILDLMMPVMSGYEFGERLRQDPSFARVPVVIVTAASNAKESIEALGAVDFLQKPIDFDRLIEVAETHCCKLSPAR